MTIDINKASVKELTTLPGIGVKFAQIIVSKREELGSLITIDIFHDNPTLQTKLNELVEKKLLIIEYIETPPTDQNAQADIAHLSHAVSLLTQQMEMMVKAMEANSMAMQANSSKISDLELKINQTQGKQLSAHGGTKEIPSTGDTIIDATLKAIGEKAPPLPAHILSTMHSYANGEKKPQIAKEQYENNMEALIKYKQKPSMPLGISTGQAAPPAKQKPAANVALQTTNDTHATNQMSTQVAYVTQPSAQNIEGLIPASANNVPHPPVRNIPKLAPYNGSIDFHAFVTKFEIMAELCKWDEDTKLVQLVGALTGKALESYAWQEPKISKDQLLKMFGKTKDPIISRAELASIRQNEDETLEEFGQRVRQITTRAYPTANTDVFETLAREAFLGCSNVEAAELALFRDPQTLGQAMQYTQTATHNHKLLSRRSRSRVRHVSFSDRPPADIQPSVQQIQIRQTGKENVDIHFDWSELNRNIRELLTCLKETTVKPTTAPPSVRGRTESPRPRTITTVLDRSSYSPPPRRTLSPYRGPSPPASPTKLRCFKCNEIGHFARECPHNITSRPTSPIRKTQLPFLNQ